MKLLSWSISASRVPKYAAAHAKRPRPLTPARDNTQINTNTCMDLRNDFQRFPTDPILSSGVHVHFVRFALYFLLVPYVSLLVSYIFCSIPIPSFPFCIVFPTQIIDFGNKTDANLRNARCKLHPKCSKWIPTQTRTRWFCCRHPQRKATNSKRKSVSM